MNAVVEQLRQSPRLVLHVTQLQQLLDEENHRRQQFYEEVTEEQKAEFINGEVVVHSPVKVRHADVSFRLAYLIKTHIQKQGAGRVYHEAVMVSLTRNDYEPDVCFFGPEKAEQLGPDQWQAPAPDFVCEVLSPSTERTDRGIKFEDYAAHGVQEYWIVDPEEETVEQYLLRGEQYELNVKARTGEITSEAINSFTIPVRSIFDDAENWRALEMLLKGEG